MTLMPTQTLILILLRNMKTCLRYLLRGGELIELCKSMNLNILNGRKTGDLFGKITSFQWNGQSVVDYALTSNELFPHISYFKVGEYIPWISDHCSLSFKVNIKTPYIKPITENLNNVPDRFYFRTNDKTKLLQGLKSIEVTAKLDTLGTRDEINADYLASEITSILIDTTKKSNIKPKKVGSRSSNEPWFDNDCVKLKNSLRKKCRKLKEKSDNHTLRSEIFKDNKKLKHLIKKNKFEYKREILNKMKLNHKDQKMFWKLLDKLHPKEDNSLVAKISGDRWVNHFKSTFTSTREDMAYPPDSLTPGPLDYEITVHELLNASYILKDNKASGHDSISNEMIKCLIEVNPTILVKLFNVILTQNADIKNWVVSIITPIYKSGSKTHPTNYRGISVISCLSKLFSSILQLRLKTYVLDHNILSDEQLGFREGNRTSDSHIILYSLIQKYCQNKNQQIYSCFVDFRKAFDSVPRDLLLKKLLERGVNGKFFNILKTMYGKDRCCVRIGDKVSSEFSVNQGVKQGCVLSPLLFNIFLSDLPNIFESPECQPVKINDSRYVGSLIWADDVVLLSESNIGLQEMIHKLDSYAKNNHLEVNNDKTKALIFNKTGRFIKLAYKMGDQFIYCTNSYKYLGFIFTPSGEITTGLKDLKSRALRAYYKMKEKLGHFFRVYPLISLTLFNTLIKPVLLYASDFWGCLKAPTNNPIENAHIMFCKHLLGVQKQTSTLGVLLELGEVPITTFSKKLCIKIFYRIEHLKKANNLLLASVKHSNENNHKWTSSVKNCLDTTGIGNVNTDNIHKKAFERMKDIFHQEAFADINRDVSKLRTYASFKTSIGLEKYILAGMTVQERVSISKIRLSNHTLMIEKGRHLKIEKTLRFCPFCPSQVETEQHFILQCKTFEVLREQLFTTLPNILHYPTMTQEDLFKFLLSNELVAPFVGNFLNKALQVRKFLVENHRKCW